MKIERLRNHQRAAHGKRAGGLLHESPSVQSDDVRRYSALGVLDLLYQLARCVERRKGQVHENDGGCHVAAQGQGHPWLIDGNRPVPLSREVLSQHLPTVVVVIDDQDGPDPRRADHIEAPKINDAFLMALSENHQGNLRATAPGDHRAENP